MAPNTCFESLSFVPFSTDESFINNENDPDVNFYNDVFTLDTQYLAPDKFQRNFKPFSKQPLSILHLNIRSINKNFEAFKQFYLSLNFNFSIVCFSETWANDHLIIRYKKRSFYKLSCNRICLLKYVKEKLETRYLMSLTGLRMETQKTVSSFVKIYFLKIVKTWKIFLQVISTLML